MPGTPVEIHTPAASGFDAAHFGPLFAAEDRHFWFRARNRVIAVLVGQIVSSLRNPYRVLEVGCGTGNTLRVLAESCAGNTVVGMDLFGEGLAYARRRTAGPLVQGDMRKPPFGTSFDLVCLFDVLEHLPDDRGTLADLRRILRPGGVLLLTVPAHPALWSYFDDSSRHCRRYKAAELRGRLVETGYEVEYLSEYMVSILPLAWIGRRVAALRAGRSGRGEDGIRDLAQKELRVTPVVNEVLAWLLCQETRLVARRLRMPAGASLLAVAREPER